MEDNNNNIYDLAIVGGATAGLTAGIYAGRKKMKTVILTKQVGGQSLVTSMIENFPGFLSISGVELIEKIRTQVENYGVKITEGVIVEAIEKKDDIFNLKLKDGDIIKSKTIIIATGKFPRQMGVPGEKEFWGKGISFCTICDAPLFSDKDTAVVGGGNSGMESVLDLVKYANKVYLLDRSDDIKGDLVLRDKISALADGGKIEIITNTEVVEVKGDTVVRGLVCKNKVSGEIKTILVSGIFVNIGWVPATEFLKGFLELNSFGEIVVKCETNETSVPGVFVAGDAMESKYKQCVIAAGEGAKSALSAYDYLLGRK